MSTLYEKLGGEKTVEATVQIFYERILQDPRVAPFFENINLDLLRKKQAAFLTFAFGGPSTYSMEELRRAHRFEDEKSDSLSATLKHLDVGESVIDQARSMAAQYHQEGEREIHAQIQHHHFDRVVDHLRAALRELRIPEPLVDEAILVAESTRREIVEN